MGFKNVDPPIQLRHLATSLPLGAAETIGSARVFGHGCSGKNFSRR